MKKRGFTLIELLVVIAIIGLLSSIIVLSLMVARTKAKDARVIADLAQIRAISAFIQDDAGSYADLCTSDALYTNHPNYGTQIMIIRNDITGQGGSAPLCAAIQTTFCVSSILPGGTIYCLGGGGKTGTVGCGNPPVATACD